MHWVLRLLRALGVLGLSFKVQGYRSIFDDGDLGFRGSGFRGFRGLGFRGLGIRGSGV